MFHLSDSAAYGHWVAGSVRAELSGGTGAEDKGMTAQLFEGCPAWATPPRCQHCALSCPDRCLKWKHVGAKSLSELSRL